MHKSFNNGFGLFVGVGGDDIPITVDDATALHDFFTDQNKAFYPRDHVKLLTDKKASRQEILDGLDWLIKKTKSNPEATVIVYYSGHGGRLEHLFKPNEYYLVPYGYNPAKRAETAISGLEFTKKIESIKAKKLIVLLDCCHAGGIPTLKESDSQFVKSPIPPELLEVLEVGAGRVIIASSRDKEFSLTGDPYSIFTACLLDALNGKASFENDGYSRILDILIYLFKEVPKRSDDVQHPLLKKADDLEENFPLCYYAGGTSVLSEVESLIEAQSEKAASTSLTSGQMERLRLELSGLQEEFNLRLQKISRIRKALSIEDDVMRIFKYEQSLLDDELALANLKNKIENIEHQIGA